MTTPQVAPAILREYGRIAGLELAKYLQLHVSRGSEYLREAVREYPSRGGRALRPALCIAAARAFGASTQDAVNSAVAIELMHNAFLVHDDIEDASEERRGHPTLHKLHGVPVAINVGDALSVLSLRPLLENQKRLGTRVALRILEEAEQVARETVEGQAIELGWRSRNTVDLGEGDYLRMVLKKTCWYTTILPIRLGALIATRDTVDLRRFVPFGFFVGAAFQIQDDVLNLIGEHKQYGKEINGDLWEGKRTLMIVHLLNQTSGREREALEAFLALERKDREPRQVQWVRRLMDSYASIEYGCQVAHGLAGAAQREFQRNFRGLSETRDLRFLGELPAWVIART